MIKFLERLIGRRPVAASKNVAKERLQVVLVYDRARIAPGLLEQLRDEIISSLSKHIDVDKNEVALSVSHEEGQSRLVAEIPLKPRARSSEG